MSDRIVPLDGVRNFRDFGGYPTQEGGQVRRGLLYRSGHHAEASPGDIARMDSLSIVFQADLRRPDERERQAAKWCPAEVLSHDGGRETTSPHIQFLSRVEASAEAADDWMNDYYRTAPFRPHHVALFAGWFDRLAGLGEGEAALVNCAAGKDRTGILCALTKHVLGVADADILADYELTNVAVDIESRLPDAQAYFNDMLDREYPADVYRPFMGVRGRYLRTAFAAIEAQAGSLDAYLTDTVGLTEGQRSDLKARLVSR